MNDTHPSNTSTTKNTRDDEEIVLFYRNPADSSRTLLLLRSGCLFSTFHTAYWMWYNTDFIPLVNQSPIPELHIDPMLGIGGLAFAALMQAAFFIYPSRLLSSIAIRPAVRELVIYTHRFPLLRPSLSPSRRFVIPAASDEEKDITFAPLTLSPSDAEALGGSFATFRGHLTLGTKWPRYTMDIQSAKDIVAQPDVLWDALIQPAVLFELTTTSRQASSFEDEDDGKDETTASWKRRRRRVVRKSRKKWQRKQKY